MIDHESIRIIGEWLFYLDGVLVKQEKNLIVNAGLNYLASLLANENTNNISIYLAYGTGTTAAAAGDVKLQTEGGRKIVSTKTRSGVVAKLRTFLITTEGIGTWTEFGIFMAGTSAADSGTLLNRILPTGGIAKTASTVLTIEVRITFAAG